MEKVLSRPSNINFERFESQSCRFLSFSRIEDKPSGGYDLSPRIFSFEFPQMFHYPEIPTEISATRIIISGDLGDQFDAKNAGLVLLLRYLEFTAHD